MHNVAIPMARLQFGDGVFCGAGISRAGIRSPEFMWNWIRSERAIDHRLEFAEIFHFASLGQPTFRFFRAEPGRPAVGFVRLAHLMDLHQKRLHHEFLHASGLPENALGINVEMEVTRLDRAQMRRPLPPLRVRRPGYVKAERPWSPWESPLVAAIGINQKELDRRVCVCGSRRQPLSTAKTSQPGLNPCAPPEKQVICKIFQ